MTPLWPTGIEKKTNLAFVRLKRAIQLSSEPFFFTTKIKRSRYGRNRADRRIEGTPWNSGRPNREEESVVKMADAKGLQNGAGRLLSPPGATELRLRGSSFSFFGFGSRGMRRSSSAITKTKSFGCCCFFCACVCVLFFQFCRRTDGASLASAGAGDAAVGAP